MDSMDPRISQKRIWYGREEIMEVLRGMGMPTGIDSSHTLIRGISEVLKWVLAAADDRIAGMLKSGDLASQALEAYRGMAPAISVRHVEPPGFTMMNGRFRMDGCACRIRFCEGNANEGPEGFVIPISRQRLYTGEEWIEMVALIPNECIEKWSRLDSAVAHAQRMIDVRSHTIRVYNGSPIKMKAVSLDSIVMDESVKFRFVNDVTNFLSRKSWYDDRGLPWTRRYMLNGPPGTGKTTLMKWAATNLSMPTHSFDFSDPYADGRDFVRFLEYCKRQAPCVVVMDDVDKVLNGNNRSGVTEHTLQTSLSGMADGDGLIVIATSNSMEPFQGPMRRRFDSVVEVPLPTVELRAEYIRRMYARDGIDPKTIERLARMTNGWSFDDIRAAVTESGNAMILEQSDSLTEEHVLSGFKAVASDRSSMIAVGMVGVTVNEAMKEGSHKSLAESLLRIIDGADSYESAENALTNVFERSGMTARDILTKGLVLSHMSGIASDKDPES